MARRRKSLPPFEPFLPMRWHHEMNSILATAEQVAEGVSKIRDREDINPTPVNVAMILLMRLEDMRVDAFTRAQLALRAIDAGDATRATAELSAIVRNLEAQRANKYHGVRVTTDLAYHGARLSA